MKGWPSIKIQNVDSSTIINQRLYHTGVTHLTGSEQGSVLKSINRIHLSTVIQQKLDRWSMTRQSRCMKGWKMQLFFFPSIKEHT